MFCPTLTQPHDRRNAWIIWAVVAMAFASLAAWQASHGHARTVANNFYDAAIRWQNGQPLYDLTSIHGFLYLPSAAVLYWPLSILPWPVSEFLWRLICIGTLAVGVWRLSDVSGRQTISGSLAKWELFPLVTLLSIPPALDSMRNGQMNLPLAGLSMLAIADAVDHRFWRSSLWLMLAIALKPLAIVPALLLMALYPAMLWRVPLAIAGALLLPWAFQSPGYVWQQYQDGWTKMGLSSSPGQSHGFSDLFGIVRSLGYSFASRLETLVRMVAALATLWLCWQSKRRWGVKEGVGNSKNQEGNEGGKEGGAGEGGGEGGGWIYLWSAVYLMLFNPRTENNSYVLMGPAIGVLAGWTLLIERRWWPTILLIAADLVLAASYEITRGPNDWLSPLTTAILAIGAMIWMLRHRTLIASANPIR